MKALIISDNSYLKGILTQHETVEGIVFETYDEQKGLSGDIIIIDVADKETKTSGVRGRICTIILSGDDKYGDDVCHIQKPYHISGVFEVLRRLNKPSAKVKVGCYDFDYAHNLLLDGADGVELTEKESELIKALVDASPESLDKKELLEVVWGYGVTVDTHTLETHIYRLRKKIGKENDFITTDKEGYKIHKTT